jgi:sugar lactone lactonase YvrE
MSELLRSEVALFREAQSIIAESLWWDDRGDVRWCDIDAGAIHTSPLGGDVDGRDDRVVTLPAPVSAFQPLSNGGGFVFAGADYVAVTADTGETPRRLASFKHHSERIRFNEAKCDTAGRFVVGSMNLDDEPNAAVYSVDESGKVTTLITGIGVANGFEWSDDGRTMWFTDTSTQAIYAGAYSDDGELSDVRVFVQGRSSDGLVRDVGGGFWNGIYDSGTVVHWNASGTKDLEFEVPAGHVTSVALGGADLSTLFIATARENLTEPELEAQPLTGSIFQVETTTRGFPVRSFGTPREGI